MHKFWRNKRYPVYGTRMQVEILLPPPHNMTKPELVFEYDSPNSKGSWWCKRESSGYISGPWIVELEDLPWPCWLGLKWAKEE